jgi:hypothetical protein
VKISYIILRGDWCDILLDFNAEVGREGIFMSRFQIGLQDWKIWMLRWILIVVVKLLKRI